MENLRRNRWLYRLLYFRRGRRVSLQTKTFFLLLLILILPFAGMGGYFILSQRDATERLVFESFLVRIRLVAIDLENSLKDRANLRNENPLLLARAAAPSAQAGGLRLPDALAGYTLNPSVRERALNVAPEHRSLLEFFRPAENPAELLLLYGQRASAQRWDLYLFDAAFLAAEALANENVNPGETLYLTDANLSPILSSQIEDGFQIPPAWSEGLRIVSVIGERHLLLSSRFAGLPVIGVLTRPYDEAMAPLFATARNQALLLLAVAVVLFFFSGWLARQQIRPLQSIQRLMQQMAEQRFQAIPWGLGNDERRDIMKLLNRFRGQLGKYHAMNVERVIVQEARFKAVLGNINEGILVTDRDFGRLLGNARTTELVGPADAEFLKDELRRRGLLLADQAQNEAEADAHDDGILTRAPNESGTHFFETEVDSPENGRRHLEMAVQPSRGGRHIAGGLIAVLRDVTDRKLSFDREIEYAAEYQAQFLPAQIPALPDCDFDLHYTPYIAVGGDFYDFIELPDGRHMILLADMMGHGVQAALFIALLRVSFRELVERSAELPAIVEGLNQVFYTQVPTTVLVPYVLFIYDPANAALEYVVAGHPPMLLHRGSGSNREVIALSRNNLAAGMKRKLTGKSDRITLEPGDLLFCSTDGITDVGNADGEMFGEERAEAAIAKLAES